jgi:hypothetical protein
MAVKSKREVEAMSIIARVGSMIGVAAGRVVVRAHVHGVGVVDEVGALSVISSLSIPGVPQVDLGVLAQALIGVGILVQIDQTDVANMQLVMNVDDSGTARAEIVDDSVAVRKIVQVNDTTYVVFTVEPVAVDDIDGIDAVVVTQVPVGDVEIADDVAITKEGVRSCLVQRPTRR